MKKKSVEISTRKNNNVLENGKFVKESITDRRRREIGKLGWKKPKCIGNEFLPTLTVGI